MKVYHIFIDGALWYSLCLMLPQLQSPSAEERECACATISHLVSDPEAVRQCVHSGLLRILAPLMMDKSCCVRQASVGALRFITDPISFIPLRIINLWNLNQFCCCACISSQYFLFWEQISMIYLCIGCSIIDIWASPWPAFVAQSKLNTGMYCWLWLWFQKYKCWWRCRSLWKPGPAGLHDAFDGPSATGFWTRKTH